MSGPFAVGDVVEVVSTSLPELRQWLGRQLIVTRADCPFLSRTAGEGRRFDGVLTAPHPSHKLGTCWHPDCLKKIQPPDWAAPITTRRDTDVPVCNM